MWNGPSQIHRDNLLEASKGTGLGTKNVKSCIGVDKKIDRDSQHPS
jgi:hypothetical protein